MTSRFYGHFRIDAWSWVGPRHNCPKHSWSNCPHRVGLRFNRHQSALPSSMASHDIGIFLTRPDVYLVHIVTRIFFLFPSPVNRFECFALCRIFVSFSNNGGKVFDCGGEHTEWANCPIEATGVTCMKYPAIHTNYSWSNCTISNYKYLNRSSDFLVFN